MQEPVTPPPRQASDVFSKLERTTPLEPVDVTAAALANQLQHEIDARRTERFFWIFVTSMLGYVLAVIALDSHLAPIGLFVLLVVFLIGTAAWLGVDEVVVLLHRVFNRWLAEAPDDAKKP